MSSVVAFNSEATYLVATPFVYYRGSLRGQSPLNDSMMESRFFWCSYINIKTLARPELSERAQRANATAARAGTPPSNAPEGSALYSTKR